MRRLYGLLIRIAAPLAAALVLLRGLRDPAYRRGLGERFGHGRRAAPGGLWLHAVSLGEVSAAAALVRDLRERHPRLPLVVTSATPTGLAKARSAFGETADVRYLPYDTPAAVARFLANVDPAVAIIMETELWPNLFAECARRRLPVVLANARLSSRSAARYRCCGTLFRGLFTAFVTVAAQTPEDAERFRQIGADPARLHVLGNVKFDLQIGADVAGRARALRNAYLGDRPTWIAGSTHAGEETAIASAHRALRAAVPGALLILAPRHPNRFDAVAALMGREGLGCVRRGTGAPLPADAPVLLLDTVGELLLFYATADVAFVGGSLVPIGGHNLLEPAALGVPVLTGPSNENGREIAALLTAAGAALIVADADELAANLIRLFAEPAARARIGAAARDLVRAQRGNVARLIRLIDPLIEAASRSRRDARAIGGATQGANGS
ncbi:MAG TPA: lipid IV(A) 3-deoxy-D-manno-octulosonic acid transferase [Steroidobacteraceae bacterium]|nr:lipid IV(A) 3-deoxy-D-manno-octulosonic acid transferase [Steroidobacteraceae bacterium]